MSKNMIVKNESVAAIATVATGNKSEAAVEKATAATAAEVLARTEAAAAEKAAKQAEKAARRAKELAESPLFDVLGNKVNIVQFEREMARISADIGRIVDIAKEYDCGAEVKDVTGGAVKVINLPTVRKMGKDGLLGDKDRTKARLADAVALNQLIDALCHFGVMRRQTGK